MFLLAYLGGIRLGMGHCFLKLGNTEKARYAAVCASLSIIELLVKCS